MGLRAALVVAALVAAMGGGAATTLTLDGQRHDRAVAASAADRLAQERSARLTRQQRGGTDGFQDPVHAGTAVSTAKPVRVLIPSIHVDSSLERLHRDQRGVLLAPHYADEAGWWSGGVVPGRVGAAVIVGHLDTIQGDAVFVDLRRLRPGDLIEVRMSDRTTIRFRVDRSHVVGKALFPSDQVYGPTPDAQLRLITCSEPFDPVAHSYTDNLVVYATAQA